MMKINKDVRRWLNLILMLAMLCSSIEMPMFVSAGDDELPISVDELTVSDDDSTGDSDIISDEDSVSSDETDLAVSEDSISSDECDEISESDIDDDDTDILGIDTGDITVTGGIRGTDYTYRDGVYTVLTSTPLVFDGDGKGRYSKQILLGAPSENVCEINVTIKDLIIDNDFYHDDDYFRSVIKIVDNYSCDVNITIEGTNKLTGGWKGAAIEKNSISTDGILTIKGDGKLTAKGGNGAAGIGSGYECNTANIIIEGGTIIANGGGTIYGEYCYIGGAGIGGGAKGSGSNITINSGSITAKSGVYEDNLRPNYKIYSGAGIGGGYKGDGRDISITGGKIEAVGYYGGAGIGWGCNGNGNNIAIYGGTVTASVDEEGTGIGGGDIIIEGGSVTAIAKGYRATGIKGGDITITGGTVTARGEDSSSGITGNRVSITNSIVKAETNTQVGIIGNSIIISNSVVTAEGNNDCLVGNNISITGSIVTAAGSGDIGNIISKGTDFYIHDASVKAYCDSPFDLEDGNPIYKIAIPHYGEQEIFFKYSSSNAWNVLSFPGFHKNDEKYYLWLPEGVYDFKAGSNEWHSIPVHGNTVSVNTRKIIIDDMLGSELEIVSENCYRVDDIEYNCSSATDEYYIEQQSNELSYDKHIIIFDIEEIRFKNLNLHPTSAHAAIHDLSKIDLVLWIEGTNTFKGCSVHAGIEKNLGTGKLTFMGSGTIIAQSYGGAGIGGGVGNSTSDIEFAGCTVFAKSYGESAGIGGGEAKYINSSYEGGDGYNIIITSGTVNAISDKYGAGIGGGYHGDGYNISIIGGTVNATNGIHGAGIGGGYGGDGYNISIVGGSVNATSDDYGAGIGGGCVGNGNNITIAGGNVTATSSDAGIGGGNKGSGTNITISGGVVIANGNNGAGIGGGESKDGSYIAITGGTVIATGGAKAAGIGGGGGYDGHGSNITISGGSIIATGGQNSAGIGGGEDGDGINIAITGGNVIAIGGSKGIGGGDQRKTEGIYISGGNIKANGTGITPVISSTDPTPLSLNKISGYVSGNRIPLTTIEGADYYNLTDVVAHEDGCFYFYLPEGIDLTSLNRCLVEFVTNCEKTVSSQSLSVGEKIFEPIGLTKNGYTLKGWYTSSDFDDSTKWDFARDTVQEDVILYARWIESSRQYTVSFNMMGHGNTVSSQSVSENDKVEKPDDPAEEGWLFVGWFTDKECTEEYDFDTPVTADLTLYAKWDDRSNVTVYTVSFNMMGHGNTVSFQSVSENDKVEKPDDPVEEGWIFGGWFTDRKCTEEYDFDTQVTADFTLYAKWDEEVKVTVYTVSFNMMNHGTAIEPVEVVSGNKLSKPNDPAEEGWKFGGWYTEKSCINAYDFAKPVVRSFILYAKWTKESGSVKDEVSALDARPVIDDNTTDLYLVKGQKFNIGTGWTVADSIAKKYVSINKNGVFKAKKETPDSVIVRIKKSGRSDIVIHISKPSIGGKHTMYINRPDAIVTYIIPCRIDDNLKNVLWYSASPDVATVDQKGKVTAVAKGKAKITAYINGSAYNCIITVKENMTVTHRTMHVNVGATKAIGVKGVKNWSSSSSQVAMMNTARTKVTAMGAGVTVLSAEADGVGYQIDFYAEDITVKGNGIRMVKKNNYIIDSLKVGASTDFEFAGVVQDVVFKSSKPDIAFVNEYGHIVARSKGTSKLTAKINGKTVTITVKVTD